MLVLSRKKGESIMISDNIELVVVSMDGDTVRLGIKAPKAVEVYRKEVFDTIRQSNEEAAKHTIGKEELFKIFKQKS